MKRFFIIILLFLLSNNNFVYSQEVKNQKYNPENPIFFIPKNHDPNFKFFTEKSFYKSKADWQYIIDTTWGPGDPLPQKLLIYNTYAQKVHDQFDGFISLQLNWDSLYNFYLNKITDSTSKGAFSSIMSHFAYDLKDMHTRAYDNTVAFTPLNPGVPVLLLGSYISVEHFGAVTTVLPDSTTLVLRVVPNHPLNIEPGDIILGYEGIPWKNLVQELFDAGLPMVSTTGGCKTADTYLNLSGIGLNWHLFNTIDILKHTTGDTLHLSVVPMMSLNVPPMANNEQLPIPNIPFPNVLPYPIVSDTVVTYGILENTNIGYIYLAMEWPTATADGQFYDAINALKNTDALIIDMRLNFGGWALFDNAFKILFNDFYSTIEDAYRCNINTFELCPNGNWATYKISGVPPLYDRPISVLLGPTCVSMGDLTAQRLMYHPMVRFFGASSNATLGDNSYIENFPGWYIRYSIGDMFHTNNPGVYLNRREFPIDFPVWHNPNDVAIGKDAVVEKALEWINNLVFPHDIVLDKTYYLPGVDSVHLSTIIENPNSHQLSARGYLKTVEGTLIDSVDLIKQVLNAEGENWTAKIISPTMEEFYKISVTAFDQTASTSFTLPNAARFSTAGPIVIDSLIVTYNPFPRTYTVKISVMNEGLTFTVEGLSIQMSSEDSSVIYINGSINIASLAPGETVMPPGSFTVRVDTNYFSGVFNFNFNIKSGDWLYWQDSVTYIVTGVEGEKLQPLNYRLEQNYPNPFNPNTSIQYAVSSMQFVSLTVYDILGNEVATLINEEKPAGTYKVTWYAESLPSGVYFYQLKAGEFISTKKMILLK